MGSGCVRVGRCPPSPRAEPPRPRLGGGGWGSGWGWVFAGGAGVGPSLVGVGQRGDLSGGLMGRAANALRSMPSWPQSASDRYNCHDASGGSWVVCLKGLGRCCRPGIRSAASILRVS